MASTELAEALSSTAEKTGSGPDDIAPTPSISKKIGSWLVNLFIAFWTTTFKRQIPDTTDDRYSKIKHMNIDDYPEGYPKLAAFLSSDPGFPVYRGFGLLLHRLLLYLQHELSKLEQRLNELDRDDAANNPHRLQSLDWDHEDAMQEGKQRSEREEVICKLRPLFVQYAELQRLGKDLYAEKPASHMNWHSLFTYMSNGRLLKEEESEYIHFPQDCISLSGEHGTYLHEFVENVIDRSKWLGMLFSTAEQRRMTSRPATRLYSRTRVNLVVQTITTLITSTLFLPSVSLALSLTISGRKHLAIIILSVVIFALAIDPISQPSGRESIAMTAAYCVLLAVFVEFD